MNPVIMCYHLCYPFSWYELIHAMTWFCIAREKSQRRADFFPAADRPVELIQQRASSLLPIFSMHDVACCLLPLLPVVFFVSHFFHHTAKPTDLVTSLPFRYLADCVVGWSVRVIIPVSVKHFFWLISEIGWEDDCRIMHMISKSVGRCRLPWADVLFLLFLYCGYRRRR